MKLEAAVESLCDARGFHYADDPMEYGQSAYDVTNEARSEIIEVAQALMARHSVMGQPWHWTQEQAQELAMAALIAMRMG